MIQLANDPTAGRTLRPAANEGKAGLASELPRARSGHAWPFISSTHAPRPVPARHEKPAANDSGS